MFKNFVRYYLLTVFGFFALVILIDFSFVKYQQNQNKVEINFDHITALVSDYCLMNACEKESALPFSNVNIIRFSDLAVSGSILENLKAFQVISVEDNRGHYYYQKMNEQQLVRLGPIQLEQQAQYWWYTTSFYLFIAAIIFMGLYPLFRDIFQLKSAAQDFVHSRQLHVLQLPQSRYFQPVNDSFCWMIAKISRLIALQKELSSTLSHELRTNLSRLNFSLAVMDETNLEESKKLLQQDIDELNTLIDEYLQFAKQDSQIPSLDIKMQNITPIIEHYIALLGQYSSKIINVELSSNASALVDKRSIARAIKNLIDNAIKYSTTQVLISITEQEKMLVLSIEDDGLGIDVTEIDELFLPYTRAEHNNDISGYGLGLAITRKIVDWHQGRLEVSQSTKLSGARFQLYLPMISANDTCQ